MRTGAWCLVNSPRLKNNPYPSPQNPIKLGLVFSQSRWLSNIPNQVSLLLGCCCQRVQFSTPWIPRTIVKQSHGTLPSFPSPKHHGDISNRLLSLIFPSKPVSPKCLGKTGRKRPCVASDKCSLQEAKAAATAAFPPRCPRDPELLL